MQLLCPLEILPHQVLSAHLEALREVVDLLVLRGDLQLLWLAHTRPNDVVLRARWRDDPDTGGFHGVDDGVVDVRVVVDLKAKRHILIHHAILVDLLNDRILLAGLDLPHFVNHPQEALSGLNLIAIERIGEENADIFLGAFQLVRLYKLHIRIVRPQYRVGDLSLLLGVHQVSYVLRVELLELFAVFAVVFGFETVLIEVVRLARLLNCAWTLLTRHHVFFKLFGDITELLRDQVGLFAFLADRPAFHPLGLLARFAAALWLVLTANTVGLE